MTVTVTVYPSGTDTSPLRALLVLVSESGHSLPRVLDRRRYGEGFITTVKIPVRTS